MDTALELRKRAGKLHHHKEFQMAPVHTMNEQSIRSLTKVCFVFFLEGVCVCGRKP